ncbi:RcnB family protein [Oxalobacteraceae bacterium A2-2]
MNRKIIATALLSAYLGAIGAAQAQDRGPDRGRDQGHRQDDRRDERRNDRHDDRRDDRGERRNDRYDYRPTADRGEHRGAGPRHNLYKGGRLPAEYRGRQYVVDDWRAHHLSAPPRGYHWVQTGGDYVLVAITTGIIASLLLSN